ncbi:hypothetical protein L0F63_005593 [Massospora cicadina]|nr:hypothetical protein L0F63_005593 [Massospora cicadina]
MIFPDFIVLEVLAYLDRADLLECVTLNWRFFRLVTEVALASITIDDRVLATLQSLDVGRPRIASITLLTIKTAEVEQLCRNLRGLALGTSLVPRLDIFRLVASYDSLRYLDLFLCDADHTLAAAITQNRNLTALRLPKFNLSKPRLLEFLSLLHLPKLSFLSVITDRLNKPLLRRIHNTNPNLHQLEVVSSSVSSNPFEGLELIWHELKTLKVSVVDALPERHTVLLSPTTFPSISSLFLPFPYRIAFAQPVIELNQAKQEFGTFGFKSLTLHEDLRLVATLTHFGADCRNLSPSSVKSILGAALELRTLKLHRVDDAGLFTNFPPKRYRLRSFSFSSKLQVAESVLAWLARCAPSLQHLALDARPNVSGLKLQRLLSITTGNLASYALIELLAACSPAVRRFAIWNTKIEPEWALLERLKRLDVTSSRDIEIDDGFVLGIFEEPRPLTFQPLDRLIGNRRRKGCSQISQPLYSPPIPRLCYDI